MARVIERFRSGPGGLRVTLSWPARLCGTAEGTGTRRRHGVPYAGSGQEGCACRRYKEGGLVPVSLCAEHGDAAGPPVMEWRPGGRIHCTDLSRARGLTTVGD